MNRKCFLLLIAFFVLVLMFAGCTGSARMTEQNLYSQPTFTSFPPSPTVTATITPTPFPVFTPMPVILGDLSGRTVESLCLELKQGGMVQGEPIPADLKGEVAQLLLVNGLRVVEDSSGCDASLEIIFTLQAISANYSGTWCYTGSSAWGTMTLTTKDGARVQADFKEGMSPPFVVTNCPQDKSGAPVSLAVSQALFEGFSKIWSYEFLANAIHRPDVPALHRNMAAEFCIGETLSKKEEVVPCLVAVAQFPNSRQGSALNMLTYLEEKALAAVPALIGMLEGPLMPTPTMYAFTFTGHTDVQKEVVEALKAITGQDFGTDAGKWRAWWEVDRLEPTPLPPGFTPQPCGEYQNMEGRSIQVTGVIDEVGSDEYDTWILFKIGDCYYNADIWAEHLAEFDPALVSSLKPGDRVTLTGVVTGWNKGLTFLDLQSIDAVEPAK